MSNGDRNKLEEIKRGSISKLGRRVDNVYNLKNLERYYNRISKHAENHKMVIKYTDKYEDKAHEIYKTEYLDVQKELKTKNKKSVKDPFASFFSKFGNIEFVKSNTLVDKYGKKKIVYGKTADMTDFPTDDDQQKQLSPILKPKNNEQDESKNELGYDNGLKKCEASPIQEVDEKKEADEEDGELLTNSQEKKLEESINIVEKNDKDKVDISCKNLLENELEIIAEKNELKVIVETIKDQKKVNEAPEFAKTTGKYLKKIKEVNLKKGQNYTPPTESFYNTGLLSTNIKREFANRTYTMGYNRSIDKAGHDDDEKNYSFANTKQSEDWVQTNKVVSSSDSSDSKQSRVEPMNQSIFDQFESSKDAPKRQPKQRHRSNDHYYKNQVNKEQLENWEKTQDKTEQLKFDFTRTGYKFGFDYRKTRKPKFIKKQVYKNLNGPDESELEMNRQLRPNEHKGDYSIGYQETDKGRDTGQFNSRVFENSYSYKKTLLKKRAAYQKGKKVYEKFEANMKNHLKNKKLEAIQNFEQQQVDYKNVVVDKGTALLEKGNILAGLVLGIVSVHDCEKEALGVSEEVGKKIGLLEIGEGGKNVSFLSGKIVSSVNKRKNTDALSLSHKSKKGSKYEISSSSESNSDEDNEKRKSKKKKNKEKVKTEKDDLDKTDPKKLSKKDTGKWHSSNTRKHSTPMKSILKQRSRSRKSSEVNDPEDMLTQAERTELFNKRFGVELLLYKRFGKGGQAMISTSKGTQELVSGEDQKDIDKNMLNRYEITDKCVENDIVLNSIKKRVKSFYEQNAHRSVSTSLFKRLADKSRAMRKSDVKRLHMTLIDNNFEKKSTDIGIKNRGDSSNFRKRKIKLIEKNEHNEIIIKNNVMYNKQRERLKEKSIEKQMYKTFLDRDRSFTKTKKPYKNFQYNYTSKKRDRIGSGGSSQSLDKYRQTMPNIMFTKKAPGKDEILEGFGNGKFNTMIAPTLNLPSAIPNINISESVSVNEGENGKLNTYSFPVDLYEGELGIPQAVDHLRPVPKPAITINFPMNSPTAGN